ncbi:MAG TPA: LytTR family DNA-binding domain-containing protein [Gemmatimonadaceae bacterium]|nr:LytTR family DNA-binding domain-containing protein [Gemmatimonadaceae bacterium]
MADIRVLVVDDEPLSRRALLQLIAEHPDLRPIGECRDGQEALRALATLEPDLVLLDVQMPGLDGFEVVRQWGVERMPPVVFVTAYDEFAVKAFTVHAIDYLMKPVTSERFAVAADYARRRVGEARDLTFTRRLAALVTPAVRRLAVRIGNRDILVPCDDIQCIRSDDVYARVSVGEREYVIRESLASIAQRLDAGRFVRIHRTAIVNTAYVRELKTLPNGERVAVLASGAALPIGRRRREEVEKALLGSP